MLEIGLDDWDFGGDDGREYKRVLLHVLKQLKPIKIEKTKT